MVMRCYQEMFQENVMLTRLDRKGNSADAAPVKRLVIFFLRSRPSPSQVSLSIFWAIAVSSGNPNMTGWLARSAAVARTVAKSASIRLRLVSISGLTHSPAPAVRQGQ